MRVALWIEGSGLFLYSASHRTPVPIIRLDIRERCVGFCERRIKCQGFDDSFPGFGVVSFERSPRCNRRQRSGLIAQAEEGGRELA